MKKLTPIIGYEGLYSITKNGEVISMKRLVSVIGEQQRTKTIHQKTMKQHINSFGYVWVCLSKNGTSKKFRVHRLVLMTFEPNENAENLDVNHKNGIKSDNRLSNLEWMTRSENHLHRYRVLKQKHSMKDKFGALHHRSMAVQATNIKTGEILCFDSMMSAQRSGFQSSKICHCIQGKRKTHGGCTWISLKDKK